MQLAQGLQHHFGTGMPIKLANHPPTYVKVGLARQTLPTSLCCGAWRCAAWLRFALLALAAVARCWPGMREGGHE